MGVYAKWAEIYDEIYAVEGKDYRREATHVHEIISDHKKSAAIDLLDVGCGTGGHLAYFKEWYQVTGLDLDEHMLAVARQRLPAIPFHQGDMVDFIVEKQFDAITCLFSAIGYTKTLQRMHAAIENMAKHLKPGGILVIEPWLAPDQFTRLGPWATFVDKPDLKIARCNVNAREGNVSVINFHFLVARPDGVEYFTELHEMGLFTVEEYRAGFDQAGLVYHYDPVGITGRGLHIGLKPAVEN